MPKIAAIGEENNIMMLKAAGVVTYEASSADEAIEALGKALGQNYAFVLIEENLKPAIQDILDDNPSLVYVYIPPVRGATKAGVNSMKAIIGKAVGKSGL